MVHWKALIRVSVCLTDDSIALSAAKCSHRRLRQRTSVRVFLDPYMRILEHGNVTVTLTRTSDRPVSD
jgi:hypothetical protein